MSLRRIAFTSLNDLKFNLPKTRNVNLKLSRLKIHVAMLEDEKIQNEVLNNVEIGSLTWLRKISPAFPVHGPKVTVIYEPSEFYQKLLEKCKLAKKRITLASLYLGVGKLETELVKCMKEANPNVEVTILLDYMRGSRNKLNSRKMVEPLLQTGRYCQVYLYHTPKLRGILKRLLPDRFNELIGVQHMKLYIFDDTLIISGANLSNDYFTNRQDRYVMIEDCRDLCNFYNELVKIVGRFSYRLTPEGDTVWDSRVAHPVDDSDTFVRQAAQDLRDLFEREMQKKVEVNNYVNAKETDTFVFPLVQMGQLNISHDSEVTLRLLESAPPGSVLKIGTGYFNLTTKYRDAILHSCKAICHLLTAHPSANGFFGARGLASGIPAAYTNLEKSFVKLCEMFHQNGRVKLWEYARPGWTYHAKGLWYTPPGQKTPCLTLIGSPNFGYRSVEKDLETQIVIVTKDQNLQDTLYEEQERLFRSSNLVTMNSFGRDRVVPAWVRVAVIFFRYYF